MQISHKTKMLAGAAVLAIIGYFVYQKWKEKKAEKSA
jgi:uncharacterized membrane protein YebE (DUF533 family)